MNSKPKENENLWIDLHSDLVAGIKTFSQNIALADIMSDGEWKLICADLNTKLKVFKGPILQNETKLQYTPVAIASFYAPDVNTKINTSYLAVAGGPYIFIYKNLKGTFKFLIPNIEPNPDEQNIWNLLKENTIDVQSGIKKLEELSKSGENLELSTRTLELLSIRDLNTKIQFVEDRKNIPIVISNYVVSMTTLKKSKIDDPKGTSVIIIGSECGLIYVIDHSGTKIISKFRIPSVPYIIVAYGSYDVEYRINIATRNGLIYSIKDGEITPQVLNIGSKIVSMVRLNTTLAISTMDNYYSQYDVYGPKLFSILMPDSITCMECFDFNKGKVYFKAVLIALRNYELRMYNEKQLINVYKTSEIIFSMKFGKFGVEEDVLVIISDSGSLLIKALQHSNLENQRILPKSQQEETINVPKKTKLYLDFIEREKESCVNMNQIFQNDLLRLRYKTLDTYIKMLKIGNAPQNYSTASKVKLSASLQGLGPNFRLNLVVDNTGEEAIYATDIVLEYDYKVFHFEKDFIQLGILMPNVPIKYYLKFRNVSENGISGMIKIFILDKSRTSPLITTTVKVPISEIDII